MIVIDNTKFWRSLQAKLHRYIQRRFIDMRHAININPEILYCRDIHITSGIVKTNTIDDFTLPGIIPLKWSRTYYSDSEFAGELGKAWHHNYDIRIYDDGSDYLFIRLSDGRPAGTLRPKPKMPSYMPDEKLHLGIENNTYFLQDYQGLRYYFGEFEDRNDMPKSLKDMKTLRLVEIQDTNGHAIVFNRNEYGDLIEIIDTHNRTLKVQTDRYGRILNIVLQTDDPDQPYDTLVRYAYDLKENSCRSDLITVFDAAGAPFQYRYQNHLLAQAINREEISSFFEWDDITKGTKARTIKAWKEGCIEDLYDCGVAGGKKTYYREFVYDDENRLTKITDGRGSTMIYHWHNILPVVDHRIDPMGYRISWKYDDYHNEIEFTDELGNKTIKEYDDDNRLISITNPDGRKIEYTYPNIHADGFIYDDIIKITDGDLEHYFIYDERGNMISHIHPDDYQIHCEYYNHGLIKRIYDAKGNLAQYLYDADHMLTREYDIQGNYKDYIYESRGLIACITDQHFGNTHIIYDELDNIVEIHMGNGKKQQFFYNNENQIEKIIDQYNNVTKFNYNGLDFPVERINADGSCLRYAYDSELNLIKRGNENNETYEMAYDAKGRLVSEMDFAGFEQRYQYRPNDHLLRRQDSKGDWQLYERDHMGRVINIRCNDGTNTKFSYNDKGQIISGINEDHEIKRSYNARGNLIKEQQDDVEIHYDYDERGLLTHITLPNGKIIEYKMNNLNQLQKVLYDDRLVSEFIYNASGLEVSQSMGRLERIKEYNFMGGLIKQAAYKKGSRRNPISICYYNKEQKRLENIDDLMHSKQILECNNRKYLKALISVNISEFLKFDPINNLILSDVKTGKDKLFHESFNRKSDRIKPVCGEGDIFDNDYIYDIQNQLIKIVSTLHGAKQQEVRFTYDAFGRKKSKSVRYFAKNEDASDYKVHYFWSDHQLLAEVTEAIGKKPDWAAADKYYIHRPYSFELLAQVIKEKVDSPQGDYLPQIDQDCFYYYHNDHMGTPQEMTDETGIIVWQGEHLVYGKNHKLETNIIENNIRFQGQYEDIETEF